MNRNKRNKNIKGNEAISNTASVNSFGIFNNGETNNNIGSTSNKGQLHRNKS